MFKDRELGQDIPSRREIVRQINKLYDRFGHIIVSASDSDFDFATNIGVSRIVDEDSPVASTDFTAFINHYIGGSVTGIAGMYASQLLYHRASQNESQTSVLEAGIRKAQQTGERLIYEWRETDMYHPMSEREGEYITLLHTAIHSFDWSQNLDAFFGIRRVASELGNEFSMLNHGERLIGH